MKGNRFFYPFSLLDTALNTMCYVWLYQKNVIYHIIVIILHCTVTKYIYVGATISEWVLRRKMENTKKRWQNTKITLEWSPNGFALRVRRYNGQKSKRLCVRCTSAIDNLISFSKHVYSYKNIRLLWCLFFFNTCFHCNLLEKMKNINNKIAYRKPGGNIEIIRINVRTCDQLIIPI